MSNTTPVYTRFSGILNELKRENAPVLATMVAAFRANQSAKKAQKTQFSKSGEINPTLLASYKTSEDIFLRHMITEKGENHGFVLHLDWSSSMRGTISTVLWQTLNLVWLAETLRTPIEVYVFSDENTNAGPRSWSEPDQLSPRAAGKCIQFYDSAAAPADRLKAQCHILAQIISKGQGKALLVNQGALNGTAPALYVRDDTYRDHYIPVAVLEKFKNVLGRFTFNEWDTILRVQHVLGGTPLYHAVISSVTAVRAFRERHKVEKCLSIWLTDGSNTDPVYVNSNSTESSRDEKFYSPLTGKTYGGTPYHASYGPFAFHRDATGATVVILDIGYSAASSFQRYASVADLKAIGIDCSAQGWRAGRRRARAPRPARFNPKKSLKPADREAAFREFGTATLTRADIDMGPDVVIATNNFLWSTDPAAMSRMAATSIANTENAPTVALTRAMVALRTNASMRRFAELVVPFLAKG